MSGRSNQIGETLVGAAVIAVAVGFLLFAGAQAGGARIGSSGQELVASFSQVNGIGVGSDVRMSGVKIGSVTDIMLDPAQGYYARVTLNVDRRYGVPEDSVAKVVTDALLGGAYVAIDPGGSEVLLSDQPDETGVVRNEFASAQGSIDLVTTLLQAMRASSSGGGGGSPGAAAGDQELAP